MTDDPLVEALLARDPGAQRAIYDAYASRLYSYCWSQVRGHDAAQVALRDTFIVAEAHAGKLRDRSRFGVWLYAVARRECRRRMPGRGQQPDVPIASHDQEDVEERILAWQAVAGLDPLRRELLELNVRHGLAIPDVAAVVGLPVREAQAALDRARTDLDVSLAAEILAHQGPFNCPARAGLLRERRGDLPWDLRRRLVRHAGECEVCGRARPRAVSAVRVFEVLPVAEPPRTLRVRVMSGFMDPELVGYRLFVATRAASFSPDGFPVPAGRGARLGRAALQRARRPRTFGFPRSRTSSLPRSRTFGAQRGVSAAHAVSAVPGQVTVGAARHRRVWALALASVVAALLLGGGAAMTPLLRPGERDAGTAAVPAPAPRTPTVRPQVPPTAPADRPEPDPDPVPDIGGGSIIPVSATFPLGARDTSAPSTALPSPPPERDFHSGGPGGEAPPPGGGGTLSVSPLHLDLAGGSDGTVQLTAEGGPVNWRAKATGPVRPAAASGRIEAGRTVTLAVHVFRTARSRGEGAITFEPGGVRVHITWRPGPPTPDPDPTTPGPDPSTPTPGGPSGSPSATPTATATATSTRPRPSGSSTPPPSPEPSPSSDPPATSPAPSPSASSSGPSPSSSESGPSPSTSD